LSGNRPDEISNRVHKAVFVANEVAGRPPMANVGMRAFGHNNVAKAALLLRVAHIVKLEPVQLLEIENQRTSAAIDLDRQAISAAGRKAGRFQAGQCSIAK